MTLTPVQWLRACGLLLLLAGCAALPHYAISIESVTDFSTATGLLPLLAIVVIILWRLPNRLWTAAGLIFLLALLAGFWGALRQNIALLYYIEHVGTNLALAVLFGRTLFGQQEALVTRFARLAQTGEMSAAKRRYTRQVTIAWTGFFLLMVLTSSGLFWLAPASAWSTFANLLTMPLVGLMFVVEHLVRMQVLAPEDYSGVADTIRGYRASMQQAHAERMSKN